MRIYYLEEPLSEDDQEFVREAVDADGPVEQVRIPYVLPALNEPFSEEVFRNHRGILQRYLRKSGISRDRGRQVVITAPRELYWHAILAEAVFQETGHYPYLVQTESQRTAIGNPGSIRLLDGHGLMGFKD